MNSLYEALYACGIYLYVCFIHCAALFNLKAKQWVKGRTHWRQQAAAFVQQHGHPHLWVHCASAGEFEQARTVIDRYRHQFPTRKILLTFYSPSGYELRKNYPSVDGVLYLPADTRSNAKDFIRIIQPKCVAFVKYEYWYFILKALHQQQIPTILISAVFRADQPFWKSWGKPLQACLGYFTCIFTQNQASLDILSQHGIPNGVLSGDTRFDRVTEIAAQNKHFENIDRFVDNSRIVVAGSTWPADEILLQALYNDVLLPKGYKLIIAPHEIAPAHITSLQQAFKGSMLYSQLKDDAQGNCLIIDNVGMLAHLYTYATWAYIGGGFGAGIHNILEAAAYGKPVVFGPRYDKFYEAKDLIEAKGAYCVTDKNSVLHTANTLDEHTVYSTASNASAHYVRTHTGATMQVMEWLQGH